MYYQLKGATKDYIWGGTKLQRYGYAGDRIAEAWVLSFHPDGPSTVDGRPATEVLPRKMWGRNCDRFAQFPVLVKLIDARDDLSVQVHPSDEYALKNEGQYGKTEMWYVLEADAGAGLYVGFKESLDKETFRRLIETDGLVSAMNFFPVKPGDCFFIPAGTVHAIGKGCLIAEVQQNSNLTYRVYDHGRLGADGKPRPLHIDKAVAVADCKRYERAPHSETLASCDYFTVREGTGTVGEADSFTSVLFVSDGTIDGRPARTGDSYFVPAGERAEISGKAIITTVG